MSFIDFVKNSKHALDVQGRDFYIVIGNESCDFDSIASALGCAYHMSNAQPTVIKLVFLRLTIFRTFLFLL
jgi:inorganic pyrophosphatase/exopolyphosphatase